MQKVTDLLGGSLLHAWDNLRKGFETGIKGKDQTCNYQYALIEKLAYGIQS